MGSLILNHALNFVAIYEFNKKYLWWLLSAAAAAASARLWLVQHIIERHHWMRSLRSCSADVLLNSRINSKDCLIHVGVVAYASWFSHISFAVERGTWWSGQQGVPINGRGIDCMTYAAWRSNIHRPPDCVIAWRQWLRNGPSII